MGEFWTSGDGVIEMPVSWSRSCRAVGRRSGSLARAAATSDRSGSGTPAISGSPYMTRYRTAWVSPVPNGGWPVAASGFRVLDEVFAAMDEEAKANG